MGMLLALSLVCSLSIGTSSIGCLNGSFETVSWWTILKTPPATGQQGFGYYDSLSTGPSYEYSAGKVDFMNSALRSTFQAINNYGLQFVAWNDQKPTGQTSSSSAHSKGILAILPSSLTGFLIVHSIPKYPAVNAGVINTTINGSQNIYGQHIACFSLTLTEANSIAERLRITRPFVYASSIVNSVKTSSLYQLGRSNFTYIKDVFQTYEKNSMSYRLMAVFKNDILNASIFEDGLTQLLKTPVMYAETWGRPLEPSWCSSNYTIANVKMVQVGPVLWNQTLDHSKWAVGGNFACFGDMNRMNSQWKRGGAFYCIDNPRIAAVLNKTIQGIAPCLSENSFLKLRKQ